MRRSKCRNCQCHNTQPFSFTIESKLKRRYRSNVNINIRSRYSKSNVNKSKLSINQINLLRKITSPKCGIELTTSAVRVSCSTDWAIRAIDYTGKNVLHNCTRFETCSQELRCISVNTKITFFLLLFFWKSLYAYLPVRSFPRSRRLVRYVQIWKYPNGYLPQMNQIFVSSFCR